MPTNPDRPRKDGLRVLFPTLIYEAWYPDYESEKEKLIAFVRRLREEDKEGQRWSAQEYPSGYTSYFSRNHLYTEPELAGLVNFIHACAGNFAQQHLWDTQNFQPVINSMFANINPKFSFHSEHLHPYSHISGVFYARSEAGSPAISFKDPRPGRWMMPPAADGSRPENTFNASVAPEAGKLLIFPSWLEHEVPQNTTDEERISMPFNFEMCPKQA
ncbi:MAG: TIGR02466 family protein [Gammaproteobacteria bacterium]|jgi:uncharacterized protein (TIGR02466 family)|nr:TIGR02466 family protein [Gammaproteobacteria bacterium]MDP6734369.1 TIGR02466 family protein [Gammaproteobacteria bacterium]HAJ75438.1 hypothetical protein [Gammaproteobacteria bacterium]|tara:strand:- start:4102 stop:4749 length:648 start_codon:yes stop_codon:yes gene_type:complete